METKSLLKKGEGMEVLLNYGKDEMDSATIPIQWFFTEETARKKPTHLLIVEQDKEESEKYDNGYLGMRYFCKVEEGIKFVQLFRPGCHRILVLAFSFFYDEDLARQLADFLLHGRGRSFYHSVSFAEMGVGVHYIPVAGKMVEFEVPQEVFAKKPETKFQKMVWYWANWPYRRGPRDECDYLKRKVFSVVVTSFCVFKLAAKWLLKCFFMMVLQALSLGYICVAVPLALFFGFRPHNPIELIKESISEVPFPGITKYGEYRMWAWDSKAFKGRMMPVTGIELVLYLGSLIILAKHYDFGSGLTLAALFVFAAITSVWFNRFFCYMRIWEKFDRREKMKEKIIKPADESAKTTKEIKYINWLRGNFPVSQKPAMVDLKNLPKPFSRQKRIIQKFKVGYWALRARVCKPYAQ